MGLGRGVLLWLLGVPIPIIILIALFWTSIICCVPMEPASPAGPIDFQLFILR